MRSSTAAVRYAKALFSLCEESQSVTEVRSELETLAALLGEHAELREALQTPLYPAEQRKAVLQSIARLEEASPLLIQFCAYLIDQRRLIDFDNIVGEFGSLADEKAGLLVAEISTASPLDETRKDRLQRALSVQTGRDVSLEITVAPELIAGVIAKVGDRVFDGSLRTQLSQLRSNLTKEP